MPSKSKAQHNLMEKAAHDPAFAKKRKISLKAAKDFVAADKAAGYRGAKLKGLPQRVKPKAGRNR